MHAQACKGLLNLLGSFFHSHKDLCVFQANSAGVVEKDGWTSGVVNDDTGAIGQPPCVALPVKSAMTGLL